MIGWTGQFVDEQLTLAGRFIVQVAAEQAGDPVWKVVTEIDTNEND